MSTAWKTVRVFISSTFRDMQGERDWLVRFVFPKLREELLKYRIHFVDVDLRWGVTGDHDALSVCREVIDECHPRFMCMLGGRFGCVPPDRTESITADEVHYGVLGREAEERGHSFFYFRDDSTTARIVEETPGDFREPDGSDSAQKLAALKQSIINAGLPVFMYDAQWDAAQKRFTGLEAFGKQVNADLLRSLKDDPDLAARFTTEGTVSPDEFADEADQMEAFIEERTERYVIGSREPLLREMLAFATADGTPNVFVLTGDPGSGKSALLTRFTRDLSEHPSVIRHSSFVIPHFVGASAGSTDLRRTLGRVCHHIALAAGNTEPLPLDIKDLITHLQKLLAEAAARRRVILVFDALNQFDATDGAHWMSWLPRELPPGVRIVASVIAPADGQPEHQTLAILRARPGTRIVKLEPLTETDTIAIIEGYLRRYSKRLSEEQIAALLAKPAGRLPLYVLTALEELRTLGTYEEITARIRTLPGDARALFGWILTERLARDPGFRDREGRPCGAALVEKFAACLGVSRHGLSPAELAALLDLGDPLGNVAALLRLLRPYLMRRGELLDFYHGQFRDAAEKEYLDDPETARAYRLQLADYFERQTVSARKLSELPWQLYLAEQSDHLRLCLTEPTTFYAITTEQFRWDLVRYWSWLANYFEPIATYSDATELWKTIVAGEEHFATLLGKVAMFYGIIGKHSAAIILLRRSVEILVQSLGPEHNGTLVMMNNLARSASENGEFAEAEALLQRTFEVRQRTLGENHPSTLLNRINLAEMLRLRSHTHNIRAIYEKVLETGGEVQSVPGTDDIAKEFTDILNRKQDPDVAESLLRVALVRSERELGNDHHVTLTLKNNLGLLLTGKCDFSAAEPFYLQALEGRERVLGSEHPDTLVTVFNLAALMYRLGDYTAAEPHCRRALIGFEKMLGPDHPSTRRARELMNEVL